MVPQGFYLEFIMIALLACGLVGVVAYKTGFVTALADMTGLQ